MRKQIDGIDEKILDLINKRGKIALLISEHKQQNSLKIYDPGREKEIEKKLLKINPGPLSNEFVNSIFREIVSGCRSLQKPTKVGYLGPYGSFSNQAAFHKFGSSSELVPLSSFEEVFEEVNKKRLEFGIIPIENSVEGSIGSVLDILLAWDLKISSEYFERISHFLLSKSGKLSDIKVVASHPQALGQCRKWVSRNLKNIELYETASTAAAAKTAAEDSEVAAIASEYSASIYNLKILQSHIEDSAQNTTRFLIIGHEESPLTGEDKTSIAFSLKDEPGALQKSLFLPFADANINLTKIESRPSKDRPWEYVFFVDFFGHHMDKTIRAVIKKVEKKCIFLKILGSYPVGKIN
ncbi:MAG: prephenate dehydratase [Thermodesulfobacteriota bacterium]